MWFFFFFQAEDGIRDSSVTGVQTCALPIWSGTYPEFLKNAIAGDYGHLSNANAGDLVSRSAADSTRREVLAHLTRENNNPKLARDAVEAAVRGMRDTLKVDVTQHGGS